MSQRGRKAPVMRHNLVFSESVAEVTADTFRETARIYKYERRLMSFNQVRETAVDLRPDLIGHHRLERRTRQFDRQIQFPRVAAVNNRASRVPRRIDIWCSDKESRYLLDGLLRRRQTDPL